MRYESEILYDLMKRDGLLNPSQDNLPYESELKEKYVNDVIGAYPKLQDYRAEWLNYNKCEYIPADFPTESQTNQTSGTFENVIPFAYDVAKLKGQTLITIYCSGIVEITANGSWVENHVQLTEVTLPVKPSTDYLFVVDIIENSLIGDEKMNNSLRFGETESTGYQPSVFKSVRTIPLHQLGNYNFILTTKSDITNINIFDRKQLSKYCKSGKIKFRYMVIEHQQGMENWDIPYFEGMQSVQMPVLTTTGKNLYPFDDINFMPANLNTWYMSNGEPQSRWGKALTKDCGIGEWFYVEEGYYSISCKTTYNFNFQVLAEGEKIVASNGENNRLFSSGWYTIRVKSNPDTLKNISFSNIQIEKGTVKTTYERYKTNILSASEDVVLRGIGGVKDTLNCLTGELTERIGEIVFDGGESWEYHLQTNTNTIAYRTPVTGASSYSPVLCDRFINQTGATDTEHCFIGTSSIAIFINRSRLSTVNIAGFKEYLQSNPLTIQYRLANETIKTVELSCINENNVECDFIPLMDTMHYQTSSNTIPPLADLTVCVEATTQNLASFVELEGVEPNE